MKKNFLTRLLPLVLLTPGHTLPMAQKKPKEASIPERQAIAKETAIIIKNKDQTKARKLVLDFVKSFPQTSLDPKSSTNTFLVQVVNDFYKAMPALPDTLAGYLAAVGDLAAEIKALRAAIADSATFLTNAQAPLTEAATGPFAVNGTAAIQPAFLTAAHALVDPDKTTVKTAFTTAKTALEKVASVARKARLDKDAFAPAAEKTELDHLIAVADNVLGTFNSIVPQIGQIPATIDLAGNIKTLNTAIEAAIKFLRDESVITVANDISADGTVATIDPAFTGAVENLGGKAKTDKEAQFRIAQTTLRNAKDIADKALADKIKLGAGLPQTNDMADKVTKANNVIGVYDTAILEIGKNNANNDLTAEIKNFQAAIDTAINFLVSTKHAVASVDNVGLGAILQAFKNTVNPMQAAAANTEKGAFNAAKKLLDDATAKATADLARKDGNPGSVGNAPQAQKDALTAAITKAGNISTIFDNAINEIGTAPLTANINALKQAITSTTNFLITQGVMNPGPVPADPLPAFIDRVKILAGKASTDEKDRFTAEITALNLARATADTARNDPAKAAAPDRGTMDDTIDRADEAVTLIQHIVNNVIGSAPAGAKTEAELLVEIPLAMTAMMTIANVYDPGTASPQDKQNLKIAIENLIVLMDATQGKPNLAADFDQANADLGPTLRVLGVTKAAINNNGYTYVKTHPADFNNLFI